MIEDPRLREALASRYRLLEELGRGGMGAVYRAQDLRVDREVALKVQLQASPEHCARLRREAQTMARVRHPGLPEVYELGVAAGVPWIAMQLVQGRSLDRLTLEEGAALDALMQVAAALQAVHDQDLLHRDLKPANLMRAADGRTLLMDFGLAFDPDQTRITETGMVGTLNFLAPEVLRGEEASPAADWYAWGVTLFRVAEARPPYQWGEVAELLTQADLSGWPTPQFERLDPAGPAARAVTACMAVDPQARPADVRALRALVAGPRRVSAPTVQAPSATPTRAEPAPPEAVRSGSSRTALARQAQPTAPSAAAAAPLAGDHPGPGRARALAVGLAAGALAVLAAALGPAASGDAPAPSPGSAATAPPPPRIPEALRPAPIQAELAAARSWRWTAEGEVVPGPAVSPMPAGQRPFFDDDPRSWWDCLQRLPRTLAAWRWLVDGGRPEDLDAAGEEALEDIDRELSAVGMAPIFRDVARLTATGPPETVRPEDYPNLRLNEPLRLRGWAATSWRAFEEALRFLATLQEDLPNEPLRSETSRTSLSFSTSFGLTKVKDYIAELPPGAETRRKASVWLEDGIRALRRGLYAGARSLEEEPASRDLHAWFFIRCVANLDAFFHSHVGELPMSDILGRRPVQEATRFLAAETLREALRAQDRAPSGTTRDDGRGWANEAKTTQLRQAYLALIPPLSDEDPEVEALAVRRRQIFDRLLRISRAAASADQLGEVLALLRPDLEKDLQVTTSMLVDLAAGGARHTSALRGEDLRRVLAAMDRWAELEPDRLDPGFFEARARLAEALGEE